uniref:Cation channel sperm associated 2 n=1 Tax=Pelodiscus sinensis TaxID=13735 RepID=K7FSF4_PELSI
MIFILLLFLFFFYVFAVSGIFFFESYSRSDRTDLEYSMYFRDFPNTLVTLFILFTMDHWYALLQDTWKIPEMSKVISSLYIILWLLVGSFMFRNIFVAITVTNFQTIRSDLAEEVKKIETQKKADLFKMQIRDSRRGCSSQGSKLLGASLQQVPGGERGAGSRRRGSPSGTAVGVQGGDKAEHEGLAGGASLNSQDELTRGPPPGSTRPGPTAASQWQEPKGRGAPSPQQVDWETYIHQNLQSLVEVDEEGQVVWPSDSLFRYLELLEQLQHNLEEHKRLQHYA